MAEKVDTNIDQTNRDAGNALPAAQETAPIAKAPANLRPEHTNIKGRFNQYTSGFWGLVLPMLGARYSGRYVSEHFHLHDSPNYFVKRAYGIFIATVMLGTTALYTSRTWGDMKRIYGETLAYEFDKKPENVGIRDFIKSKNTIVHGTLSNFIKRTSLRGLFVNAPFFNFLLPGVVEPPGGSTRGASIYNTPNLGTGTTSFYLATDAINRKQTFFEALQNLIDSRINHAEGLGQPIMASDLINLYAIHVRDTDLGYKIGSQMDAQMWKNDQALFKRMAELMNQTYGNEPPKEHADFTIPKFIYLLGHHVIKADSLEKSLSYLEIANRYGIPAVKQTADALKSGSKLEDVLKRFPVSMPALSQENIENQLDTGKFTEKLSETRNMAPRPVNVVPSSSYVEKTAKSDSPGIVASV